MQKAAQKPRRKAQLTDLVDQIRSVASQAIPDRRKGELGQYFTPAPVTRLMASMLPLSGENVRVLDAGAGVGVLFAACVERLCGLRKKPASIEVVAFEIDPRLSEPLRRTAELCERHCADYGIDFRCDVRHEDFLAFAASHVEGRVYGDGEEPFTGAVLNPPYFKIQTHSPQRRLIRRIGLETTNIYAGFVAGATELLAPGGQLVAITPRSFCNGPYFRPFRQFLLQRLILQRLHVFESRSLAFRDDDVLQENLIFAGTRSAKAGSVQVSASVGPDCKLSSRRKLPHAEVVAPESADFVIHVAADGEADDVARNYGRFTRSLQDLGLNVSTGRVVDFRAKEYLRKDQGHGTVPLIYPTHMRDGFVRWPSLNGRKANAIVSAPENQSQLVPSGFYVLVKRFSAKEERRRITAAVFDPRQIPCPCAGFENHLNFFHRDGQGLDEETAKGLMLFLNSTLVDAYFRQFSGHTQVNATDLRRMRYPTMEQLQTLGKGLEDALPSQAAIDRLVEQALTAS